MHRHRLLPTILVAASLALLGSACDGTGPTGLRDVDGPDGSNSSLTGRVESASLSQDDPTTGVIVLEGDVLVRITSETDIDGDGDFLSLSDVLNAIEDGARVRIEFEGTVEDGVITATEIRFESDDDDGDDDDGDDDDGDDNGDDDEVHGIVAIVDLGARTVTLADGRLLHLSSDDLIEVDGDFLTLAAVSAALAAGVEVRLEADLDLSAGAFEVTSVKFESDEADGPGDDDDDDGDDDNSGPGGGDDDDNDDDDGDDDNSGPGGGDDDDDDDGDDNSGPGHDDDDDDDGDDNSGPDHDDDDDDDGDDNSGPGHDDDDDDDD
jgi:hypothetical protein